MKKLFEPIYLSLFTLLAGACGMLLSTRFYDAAAISNELLDHTHPSSILLIVLCGIVLVALFVATRFIPTEGTLEELLPTSPLRGIGTFVGTVGIAICCIQNASGTDFLTIISLVVGIFAGICMLFVASQRLFRMDPHPLFYAVCTIFLMLLGLVRCRQWGAQTQVLWFFFSLVAQVFLLLTAFQYTSVCTTGKNTRNLIFCSHAAIFFCCAAFPARYDPFYLTSAIWLALDGCFFKIPKKE